MSTPAERLPMRIKAGAATAELGMAAVEVMIQLYLLKFYTEVVGLAPQYAGYALALAVIWDAITDPAMGTISDRTATRWGRRRPYLLLGAVWLAGFSVFLFSPPALDSQLSMFLYLLAGYILTNTGMTILSVPHAALCGEISFDRNERTVLFGWRLLFANAGFLLGTLLPALLLAYFQQQESARALVDSRSYASQGVAAGILITAAVTLASVRLYDPAVAGAKRVLRWNWPGLWSRLAAFHRGLRDVVTNKVFLPLLIAFALASVGRTMNASLALYYYEHRLALSETTVTIYILGLFMLVLSVSIPAWVWLSKRWGKKTAAFRGALTLGLTNCVIYLLFPEGLVWPPMVFASILAGFLVGSIIIFESLVADVVDYDELMSGQHREGLYFGCWKMSMKLSRAVGLAATGLLLDWIGFVEGATKQPEIVGTRLAWLFGPGVGVCFAAGALVFLFMPLTEDKHRRVQAMLDRRRNRRAVSAQEPGAD